MSASTRRRYRGITALFTLTLIAYASAATLHAQDRPCPKMKPGDPKSVGSVSATGSSPGINDYPHVAFDVDNDNPQELAVELKRENDRGRLALTMFRMVEKDGHVQWRKLGRLARFEKSGKGSASLKIPPGRYTMVFSGRDMRYSVTLRTKSADTDGNRVIASHEGRL